MRNYYLFLSAEELRQSGASYGEGEESWGGQGSCSCYGGHGGISVFGGSEHCSCSVGREGTKGVRGRRGSRGIGGFGGKNGAKGHRRSSRKGSSDREGKDGVRGQKGRDKEGSKGKGGAGAKGGDAGNGDSDSDTDMGDEGGDGGSDIGGKGGRAIATKGAGGGLMQNINTLFAKMYDYCGPVGLWNVALAMMLLGYYGKSYYWDSARGRGYSTGGPQQIGGKKIKCPPKAPKHRDQCCGSCACLNRPKILKHRLKWPEEDPCHR